MTCHVITRWRDKTPPCIDFFFKYPTAFSQQKWQKQSHRFRPNRVRCEIIWYKIVTQVSTARRCGMINLKTHKKSRYYLFWRPLPFVVPNDPFLATLETWLLFQEPLEKYYQTFNTVTLLFSSASKTDWRMWTNPSTTFHKLNFPKMSIGGKLRNCRLYDKPPSWRSCFLFHPRRAAF